MQISWVNSIRAAGSKVLGNFTGSRQHNIQWQQLTMPEVIEQARLEWQDAQDYYNTVTEEDLIDHAAYRIRAAEKRYMYLMKKARQEGIHYSRYTM